MNNTPASIAPIEMLSGNVSELDAKSIDALAELDLKGQDLSVLNDKQLRRLERNIARKFHGEEGGGIPWTPVIWGIGNSIAFLMM
ncbi:hypothetical protein MNBD_ALPHA04-1465, partial [hydrothermal vent metagenome]